MSRPTTRVLTMLEMLQARGMVPGADLVARLDVDPRTVRRYAGRLRDMGVPVEAVPGRHGGYRLRPGYRLPPLMLTDDEATAVVLGLAAARQAGLTTATAAVDGALAKIGRVLPRALRDRVLALESALGFTRAPVTATPPATEAVLALADAVARRRRVRIRHVGRDGVESEREVDPYGLVVHAGRWYLAGHDHRSGEERAFRADRVRGVREGRDAAVVPADADPVAVVARSLARAPWRWEVEVVLEADPAAVRARVPPTSAEVEAAPGGTLLRARAEDLDGMARMLAGLGWRVRVRRPPELREALAALAARLAADAAGGTAGTDR